MNGKFNEAEEYLWTEGGRAQGGGRAYEGNLERQNLKTAVWTWIWILTQPPRASSFVPDPLRIEPVYFIEMPEERGHFTFWNIW